MSDDATADNAETDFVAPSEDHVARIAELEATIAERDAKIAELHTYIEELEADPYRPIQNEQHGDITPGLTFFEEQSARAEREAHERDFGPLPDDQAVV